MGTSSIGTLEYEKMLDAFRMDPANFAKCARRTGVSRPTVKKAWEIGWANKGFRPIREVIDEEQQAARARLHEVREAEIKALAAKQAKLDTMQVVRAEDDAIQSRAEEAKMVRAARHTSMSLMAATQHIIKGAFVLAQRVEENLANATIQDPKAAVTLFRELSSMVRQVNESAKIAQAMERSLVGEPEKYIGIAHNVTLSEAASEVEKAQRAIARVRRKGGIIDMPVDSDGQKRAVAALMENIDGESEAIDLDPPAFGVEG